MSWVGREQPRHRWQRIGGDLRLLSAAIALVDAEPELAELGEDGLAVAWRIFRKGWNTSRNGPVLFDELAAELVMADYHEHGARIQVDMDHVSLNKESKAYDPRGLGYHDIELREDGSLWACRAVWTKRGAECLESDPDSGRAAELPYYSPAFDTDTDLQFGDEPDRVTYIFNGGLVGTPATDRPMALAAASRRRKEHKMDPTKALKLFRAMAMADRERLLTIWKLTDSQTQLPPAKLAGLLKWQDGAADDVDPKVLSNMVKQIPGGDPNAGIGGLMRQLRAFMEMAMSALMGEEPAAAPVETVTETMADNPAEPDPEMIAANRKRDRELRELRAKQEADRKLVDELRKERDAAQLAKRRELVAKLGWPPPQAWVDPSLEPNELVPKGSLATMPMAELEAWANNGAGSLNAAGLLAAAPVPASGYRGVVTQPGLFEVSDQEERKLKALARKNGRDPERAWSRYLDQRTLECANATGAVRKILSRRYSNDYRHPDARRWNVVLSDFNSSDLERYRTWATQAPIEGHSAVSIAAMRTYDERYNMLTAAPRKQWVETVGDMKPGGTIGDETYPIDFEELFWELKTAQGPGLETPQIWNIDVRKKRYTVGATANMEMLETPGSFDYLTSTWLAKADKMARAKDRKIAQLAMAILIAPGAWLFERFLDGKLERMTDKRMFAVDHPINHWKPEVKDINGNTTWSNYETTATPFESSALTVQKTKFAQTPNYAGEFLQMAATHVLAPTSLYEEVNNKLTVQDRILSLANVGGTDVEGQVTSPHIGSGMTPFEIPDMPGVDLEADWMLFSEERKMAGYVPFLVCVGTERVKIYGPDSDFAKDSDHIKEVREVDLRAVPIRPEAVRWIVGKAP